MQFAVQLPVDRVDLGTEFVSAQGISDCASFVEASGFDAIFVTDHPIPDNSWLAKGGHHSFDPFVALSCVAGCTSTLKLLTNILVLPYRNPFIVAKSIASLDTISNGRVIMGVGAGYLEGEFNACGAELKDRGKLMEEALQAMKLAWLGETVKFKGKRFAATDNTALPRPIQRPHPPIWIGGNSDAAMRRAAQYCDGWLPFPVQTKFASRVRTKAMATLDDLKAAIKELRELEKRFDREKTLDVGMVPFGLDMLSERNLDADAIIDQCQQLKAMGVTWVNITLPSDSLANYKDTVSWFAEHVIQRLPGD